MARSDGVVEQRRAGTAIQHRRVNGAAAQGVSRQKRSLGLACYSKGRHGRWRLEARVRQEHIPGGSRKKVRDGDDDLAARQCGDSPTAAENGRLKKKRRSSAEPAAG